MTTITDINRRDMVQSAAIFHIGEGDWRRAQDPVRAGAWAVLASLAIDTLRPDHRDDLYHAALQLEALLNGPDEFFYGVSATGAQVARYRSLAERTAGEAGQVYIVTVRRQGGQGWQLCVTLDTLWRTLRHA